MDNKFSRSVAKARIENAEDLAAAREWYAETSSIALGKVWDRLQIEHTDPIDEAITRLAALKLAELFVENPK